MVALSKPSSTAAREAPTPQMPVETIRGIMNWLPSNSEGAWIEPRLGDRGTVTTLLPTEFEAYVRVLHPLDAVQLTTELTLEVGAGPEVGNETSWTWQEVAQRASQPLSGLTQLRDLLGGRSYVRFDDNWQVSDDKHGDLDPNILGIILETIAEVRGLPGGVLFGAMWCGYFQAGNVWGGANTVSPDVLSLPGREYRLFNTTFENLQGSRFIFDPDNPDLAPQLLWPRDHSWCISTDLDFNSTLIGGPQSLVAALVSDSRLEAFEVPANGTMTTN